MNNELSSNLQSQAPRLASPTPPRLEISRRSRTREQTFVNDGDSRCNTGDHDDNARQDLRLEFAMLKRTPLLYVYERG